jgi:hypothetical protein
MKNMLLLCTTLYIDNFYVENEQSFSYMKSMRLLCSTLYEYNTICCRRLHGRL